MFLRRQKEVSFDFSTYISENILNSQNVWASIIDGPLSNNFNKIILNNVKFPAVAATISGLLKTFVGQDGLHPIHAYTTKSLNLRDTLVSKMNGLSSAEFEQVLHPGLALIHPFFHHDF